MHNLCLPLPALLLVICPLLNHSQAGPEVLDPSGDIVLVVSDSICENSDGPGNERDMIVPARVGPPVYVSSVFTGSKLFVYTETDAYGFTPYRDDIVRISFHPGQDTTFPESLSLVAAPEGEAYFEDEGDKLIFQCGDYEIWIQKEPLYFDVLFDGEELVSEGLMDSQGNGSHISFIADPGSKWFGGGSRALPMNRAGYDLQIYNRPQYGYSMWTDLLNICIPAVVSSEGYGLYFENSSPGNLSLGSAQPGLISYSAETGPISCFVFASDDISDIMEPYTHLTGRQPLPPLWSLGYIQSRFGYENESEANEIVDEMLGQGFPMDGIIFDLQWMGGVEYMGNLGWDLGRFPDPEGMIAGFRNRGVKSICITDPYFTGNGQYYPTLNGLGWFTRNQQGSTYVLQEFWAGPSALLDITLPSPRDWFWDRYVDLFEQGVEGLWTDLGEPEASPDDMLYAEGTAREIHQTYNLRWSKFIFENFSRDYPDRRLLNVTRSGYAGMQRFSTMPWSGDVARDFGGMRAQIPIILGMGLSGVGFMHCDVGGFVGDFFPELYTRWQQMGAFIPVMRAHGTGVPPEPIYYPEPYKSAVRQYIKMRYLFLPYNYTLAWENTRTGKPMARPLFFVDERYAEVDDQYMWGDDIMVAPVLEEGADGRWVNFPEGRWIDYYDLAAYEGGTGAWIQAPFWEDGLPLFARAGSMIPVLADWSQAENTENYDGSRYSIICYPDIDVASSESRVYMDDGTSRRAEEQDEYSIVYLNSSYNSGRYEITLEREGLGYAGEAPVREMVFEIRRVKSKPEAVRYQGMDLPFAASYDEFLGMDNVALWPGDNFLLVKVMWESGGSGELVMEDLHIQEDIGIGEEQGEPGLRVYPNPVSDNSVIYITGLSAGVYTFSITGASGQEVTKYQGFRVDKGTVSVSLGEVFGCNPPPGIYSLKVSGESVALRGKLVVL